jgi:hypothetical protein
MCEAENGPSEGGMYTVLLWTPICCARFACRAQLLQALDEVVPAVAAQKNAKGGFWVLRPDSGEVAPAAPLRYLSAIR